MIPGYTFVVEDVFDFAGGVVVFVGRPSPEPGPDRLAPCDVDMVVEGQVVGRLHVAAERAGGHRPGLRSLETRGPLDVASMRGRQCLLVHRERDGDS